MGLIAISGIDLFGAALLEGAAWKQNVIYTLLIIFGMLPPSVREMKFTYLAVLGAILFFIFGGANFLGSVGAALGLGKILLATVTLFLAYRLWAETWTINKFYMLAPLGAVVCVCLLLPIEEQNIVGSGIDVLVNWSAASFTSDNGFHLFLGLTGIFAGISEILICRNAVKDAGETAA